MAEKKVKAKAKVKKKKQKTPGYPRYWLGKCLRIPEAIQKQNAGKECTDQEAAKYVGVKHRKGGPFGQEISSAIKYGLLERSVDGKLKLTEIARKILIPKKDDDYLSGLRAAVMEAPVISDIYRHYLDAYLPDKDFFDNALIDTYKIPPEKLKEFKSIFFRTLEIAKLISDHEGKSWIIDVLEEQGESQENTKATSKKSKKSAKVEPDDSCFVMMPFDKPYGSYYNKVYKPAIEKAGLKPIRVDDEIFGPGKIIDQIFSEISSSRVLIAELTTRNANVFYELGLAHALKKPVVLVSRSMEDVPFDLRHIRVILYDVDDPNWGDKLVDIVSEHILSAIQNPEEALFTIKGR